MTHNDKILALQKTLLESEENYQKYLSFLKKREQLEEEELKLLNLKSSIEIEKSLKQIKIKKQQIDHLLDKWEDITLESIESIKQDLIQEILDNHVAQKTFYEELNFQKKYLENIKQQYEDLLHLVSQLENSLKNILTTREESKKNLILNYIFGANPNIKIAQYLRECEKLSQEAVNIIPGSDEEKKVLDEFNLFLKNLHEQCKKRWGFKTIDSFFKESHKKMKEFHVKFKHFHETLIKEETTLQQKHTSWLYTKF